MITCEATYPSSASKPAASCNLQGKLQESGDQAKALQLELSNAKTELESARSNAAADSTVRQKEIEGAKVAQLQDAKKIRELKEHNEQLVGLKDQLQQEVVQMTVSRAYLSTYLSTLRKKHRLSFNSAYHVACDWARS